MEIYVLPGSTLLPYCLISTTHSSPSTPPLLSSPTETPGRIKIHPTDLPPRVTWLLVLGRYVNKDLSFDFSDELLDFVIQNLKLNPKASLYFFKLASKQQKFRSNITPYCKIVHILSRACMYDETGAYLSGALRIREEMLKWGLEMNLLDG
ncbi:hypothetical protein V6N13_143987 [Hibiscus sabdariffa]|uniref:Pentatricopeptide repeat-containing protein n=1 Tax=Hibiscus sabdariffa TaxID=183260 RepID=A0ABR2FJ19_9ROSI